MDAITAQITALANTADEAARQKLVSGLRRLAHTLESPDDTIHRYGHMSLETAAIKIGYDLEIFEMLVRDNELMAVEDMARKNGAEVVLLRRIMRYLATIDVVDEVGPGHYAANNVTRNLTLKVTRAGLGHYLYTATPPYEALPNHLKVTNYRNPVDETKTAFQAGWNTELRTFQWMGQHQQNLAYFNDYMASRRKSELSWLSVYPVEKDLEEWTVNNDDDAVYVNIGGGIGHQCKQFKEKYPNVPGRVILQDLPHSIEKALPTSGVENIAHNFFEPQPIEGAKFYFLRGVLHNHPPYKVRKILEHIKDVMSSESILLLDEMILPETGVNFTAAAIDMTMAANLAGMERTEAEWREILGEVGLHLDETFMYAPLYYEGVMRVTLPGSMSIREYSQPDALSP